MSHREDFDSPVGIELPTMTAQTERTSSVNSEAAPAFAAASPSTILATAIPLTAVATPHQFPKHAVRTFPGGLVRYWVEPGPNKTKTPLEAVLDSSTSWWSACRRRSYWLAKLQLELFSDVTLWKAATIELLGTMILTSMVIIVVTGIVNHAQDYSYFPTAIAIVHIPLIAFMILATGATSGGHLNPMISFSTCLAGLTEFPRMILYITAQIVGAIMAAYLCKHLTPSDLLPKNMLAMCSIGVDQSAAQALTLEIFADLFVLYVAFGVALDERQRQAMPSWLPPFIIGTMIAVLIYVTSTISTFGTGAIAYPTRCFGPAVAMGLVTADSFVLNGVTVNNAQWIYWIGPLLSSCIIAFFYRLVPPGSPARIAAERAQRANSSGQARLNEPPPAI